MRTVYITKDESTVLKGFFALLVLMHHVYQQVLIGEDIAFLDYFFRSLGYIVVSGFFFFSGYGLTLSNQRSKGEYLRGFLRNRFIPLYLVNVFLIVLYTIANIAFTGGKILI